MRSSILILAAVSATNAFSLRMASHIAVIGGSGKTGSEVVYQALERGCKVSTLVRTPSKLCIPEGSGGSKAGQPFDNKLLNVIKGDVTSQNDVNKLFEGQKIDGVVVALGGKTKDVGKTMLTDGTINTINAMKANGVKRVAVVTSIGAGDSKDQAPLVFKALMFTVMRDIFTDKNNQEALFINGPGSDLEYCIVRPGGLGVGAPTGVINVIDGQAGSIQRADVADFCLGAVLDKDFEYIKKTPCISSVGGTSWTKSKEAGFDGVTTA